MDENGQPSVLKTQPVIGMWAASDPEGSVPGAFTASPFNQMPLGLTRLDANILTSGNFLIGISDVRGDGRPDYRYRAHVLYADSVVPPRVSVNGGVITLQGTGFFFGMSVVVGSSSATPLAVTSTLMTLAVPAHADGPQNITVSDAASGAVTSMTGALTYGVAASDNIVLLNGANPSSLVGVQAANPMSVRVVGSDGVTPVSGATVGWSGTNGVQLSACGAASSCSVITDQNGNAATWLTASAPGASYVTATLAPGVYSPSKSVTGTLSATQSASDIGISSSYVYVSQGASLSFSRHGARPEQWRPQKQCAGEFLGGGRIGKPQSHDRCDGCERVCPRDIFCYEPQQHGAGVGVHRSGEFSMRGVLCESGSVVATGAAAGCGGWAGFDGAGVPTGGGASCGFGGCTA